MRKSSGGFLCAVRAAEHVGRAHALQGMPRARRRERVGLCMLGLLMTLGPADFSVASAGTGSTGAGANTLREGTHAAAREQGTLVARLCVWVGGGGMCVCYSMCAFIACEP
jgi:hypothetical protein